MASVAPDFRAAAWGGGGRLVELLASLAWHAADPSLVCPAWPNSRTALVVKKRRLDLIISGRMRSEEVGDRVWRRASVGGPILLKIKQVANHKAGGQPVGRVRFVDCIELNAGSAAACRKDVRHHRMPSLEAVPQKKAYTWAVEKAERFAKRLWYKHRPAAVIWVFS